MSDRKPVRPKPQIIADFIAALEGAPATERYLCGLRDGLKFSRGDIGAGSLSEEIATYYAKQGAYAPKKKGKR